MKALLLTLVQLFAFASMAQEATVHGKVVDDLTKEPVVGAKVIFSTQYRAISDYDGNFTIPNVPFGEYDVIVSMLSFDTMRVKVNVNTVDFVYNIKLGGSQELEEVKVIGNIAIDRETPVAVTNIGLKEITEELGSQDLPMILNSKPGVHATQQGGGDGEARITIRGFDQRNVGVMIDGVPVNDMENGWVYWSNWFGLDAITQQIQVQRGLGATKLAMPSVGGTMNIVTQNTGGKRQIKVRQEYGTGNFLRSSFSYKSGTLKNGWGVLFSGSYKQGDGWVDGLYTQGGFYYLKVQKKIGDHVLSLSGFGAPQHHGQRSYNQQIEYWDSDYATGRMGVTDLDTANMDNGLRYNQHWGWITDTITGKREILNERRNFYHKPQITLKDFWKVNKKLSWSNMAYVSIGKGGGQRYFSSSSGILRDEEGQVDWDQIVYSNKWTSNFGNTYPNIDPAHDPNLLKSTQILSASMNNHMWIGGISQIDWNVTDKWKIAAGLDYRYYEASHYVEVVDLLGGDYFVSYSNLNAESDMKKVGDKISGPDYQHDRKGFVQWAGGFGQAEYKYGRWSAFVNVSTVVNAYRGEDYFLKRQLQLEDTLLEIGYGDSIEYKGQLYDHTHEDLEYNSTDWKWLMGGTIKAGANLNLSERSNIFVNLGLLNRTPQYSNVVDNSKNEFFEEILNEKIYAFEMGYGFRSKKLSLNVNSYFTYWQNKPFPFGIQVPDPQDPTEFVTANVSGMDALHYGGEVDAAYNLTKRLSIEGMVSIGDWTWQSAETVDVLGTQVQFDAKGVHVGDAAQSTYAASVRFAFVKNGYVKLKYAYFDRYYSDFKPFDLKGANSGRESWEIPSYGLMSLHAGYRLKFEKCGLSFRANAFNLLNTLYISDARNNQFGTGFDANSVGVFMGQGMRFNFSLGFEF